MAGYCSTGQSPQRAVVLMEEEEDEYCIFAVFSFHGDQLMIAA
jgi:hypothetical protein